MMEKNSSIETDVERRQQLIDGIDQIDRELRAIRLPMKDARRSNQSEKGLEDRYQNLCDQRAALASELTTINNRIKAANVVKYGRAAPIEYSRVFVAVAANTLPKETYCMVSQETERVITNNAIDVTEKMTPTIPLGDFQ